MKSLTNVEISEVNGASTTADGLICVGAFGSMIVSDGWAAVFLGAAAVGSCDNFVDDFSSVGAGSDSVGIDNGFLCLK